MGIMALKNRRSLQAFSLVEMSVVLVIVGLIVGSGLVAATNLANNEQMDSTRAKLDKIEEAIALYYAQNGKLPCPADIDEANTSGTYGTEQACANNTNRIVGAVPVVALSLPKSMMEDGWGGKIVYVTISGLANSAANYIATTPDLTITDKVPNNLTTAGAYVLFSAGNDKKGTYSAITGGALPACGGTANIQDENCDADKIYVDEQYNLSSVAADYFDDLVRWKTKSNLPNVPVRAYLYSAANIAAAPQATWGTILSFGAGTEVYDPLDMHSTASNTTRITVPVAGIYRISSSLRLVDNGAGTGVGLRILVNGSSPGPEKFVNNDGGGRRSIDIELVVSVAASGYIEAQTWQNCCASLNTSWYSLNVERVDQ